MDEKEEGKEHFPKNAKITGKKETVERWKEGADANPRKKTSSYKEVRHKRNAFQEEP